MSVVQRLKNLKILIAEDHEWASLGLKLSLEQKSPYTVLEVAENGERAINLSSELSPDVVLMDIEMPVVDGIEATKAIKSSKPEIKVIMFTSHKQESHIGAALAAGANAYCMKDLSLERLIQVIEMVHEGAAWFDPGITSMLNNLLLKNHGDGVANVAAQIPSSVFQELTPRELDVLEKVALGRSNKQISDELSISLSTVKIHVSNILQKLGVEDRTQLAIKALQERLVNNA